jgi:hypothetical protein
MNAAGILLLTLLVSPEQGGAGERFALASAQDDAEAQAADAQTDEAPDAKKADAKKDEEECQVAIMNLGAKGLPADQKHVAQLLTDTMAAEIQAMDACKVVTQSDIAQMLDFEANKAAVCTDDSDSCLAEIGGALGVDRVIVGSVGVLGSSFKLQVKLQNVAKGTVEGRVDELIKGEPELLDAAARNAARHFFGGERIETAAAVTRDSGAEAATESEGEASKATEESGGFLGITLLSAGGVVGGLGLIGTIAGLAAAGAGQLIFTMTDQPADTRNRVKTIGQIGLGVTVVAALILVIGGGVAVTGLFVE